MGGEKGRIMKKLIMAVTLCSALGLNAAAYFDGGVTGTTGPDGYQGTKINLVIGTGNLAFEPSMLSYTSDTLDKTYRTYALRVANESDKYTLAGFAGMTPEVNGYSNKFVGGDITFSLTPTSGGHSRLAGPGSRGQSRGGEGITRIDVGAGLKQIMHTTELTTSDLDTAQTEFSLFGGAKILMVNLSASYTGYSYGDKDSSTRGELAGLNFVDARGAQPDSSVNFRLDLPGYPMVTPFVSYTGTKYKAGVKDSAAYLFGAYIDLNMVMANVGYQIFDNGSDKDNFITLGAGVKF